MGPHRHRPADVAAGDVVSPDGLQVLTVLVRVACAFVLLAVLVIAVSTALRGHRRGRHRVRAGRSWAEGRCCLDARDGLSCDCRPPRARPITDPLLGGVRGTNASLSDDLGRSA